MGMKYKDPTTGQFKDISVKVADSLPIGTEVDYDGETVPTGWEQVDNPNDYSTTETRIGTWIDGKPLYRKVISFSPDTNSNTVSIAHGISNLGVVIKCYGRFQSYSSNRLIPQLYYTLDQQFVVSPYSISSTNIEIGYGNWFKTSGNATNCYIIIEYTKTTD